MVGRGRKNGYNRHHTLSYYTYCESDWAYNERIVREKKEQKDCERKKRTKGMQ